MRIVSKLEQLQQGGGSGSEFELEAVTFVYQCSESRVAQVREVYQLLVPNLPPQPIPLPAELASLEQVSISSQCSQPSAPRGGDFYG